MWNDRHLRSAAERGGRLSHPTKPKVIPLHRELEARPLRSAVPQPDPWFGLRYNLNLYRELDLRFPGLRRRYEALYGDRYACPVPRARELWDRFDAACERHGLATRMPVWPDEAAEHQVLF